MPLRKLTKSEQSILKEHSSHHTKKHMDMMKELMRNGITFNKSHKITKKYIGK